MAMKNKDFLADARLFNPSARSYINEERVIADYRPTQYAEGDLLLEIIKEGLMVKPMDSYRRTRPTVECMSTTNG
jgi:hypothetical protein